MSLPLNYHINSLKLYDKFVTFWNFMIWIVTFELKVLICYTHKMLDLKCNCTWKKFYLIEVICCITPERAN